MKKRIVIALIVAILLIVAGGIMVVMGLSFAGNSTQESALTEQTVTIAEPFDSIKINTADCDVNFAMLSGRDDCMVQIRQFARVDHTVGVENGMLTIKMTDERKWTDYVDIFDVFGRTETMEITVYLPAAEYASLQVRTDTGDIKVMEEPSFKEMTLRSDTGEILCVGARSDTLDCMTSTGDISVQNSAPVFMKLHSSTGDLNVSVVEGDEVHLKTSTGEVDARNVNALMFSCTSNTGDVELESVLVEDYLQIFTTTGDVGIENSDAGTVNIETDTGDVGGNFLSPKWFQAHSDTGNVKVPSTPEGGECRIKSDTGDIRFY